MPKPTVRARLHHGTSSLDLTIPANIIEKHGIKNGDVFSVEVRKNKNGQIVIIYKRVFKQSNTSSARE